MSRLFVRTAAVTFCVALAGCASTDTPTAASLTDSAAAKAQKAQEADTAASTQSLATNLDDEIRQAQLMRTKGDFEGASRVLSQLMLIAPDDPRVVGEYGKALAQRGRTDDAIAFLERATQLQPGDWTLYSALGVAYDQAGDRAHARTAYEHALSLKPGEAVVLNNFAMSRMLAGDYDGAQQMLAQAAAAGSADPKIAANLKMMAKMRDSRGNADATAVASRPASSHVASRRPVTVEQLPPNVVMQPVPVDPQAGPVASATHAPRALAKDSHTPAKSKAAASDTPSLRTAAD